MKSNYIYIFTIVLLSAIGCKNVKTEVAHTEGEEFHEDEIIFSEKQAANANLKVEKVIPRTFTGVIKCGGEIISSPTDVVRIVAPTSGIISYASKDIADGVYVYSGMPLFKISSKFTASGDVAYKSRMAYETALNEYKRAEELVKDKIISVGDFEKIKLNYVTAKSNYEALGTPLGDAVDVVSPKSGYISEIYVGEGDYVDAGSNITYISSNKRLMLRAEIESDYFDELSKIRSANFRVPYRDGIYRLSDMNGQFISSGKSLPSATNYIPVIFEFDNNSELLPGTYAEVFLLTQKAKEVLSLPIEAVTEEEGYFYVYLRISHDVYRKQKVQLGDDDGLRVEVISGLNSGDEVVIDGVHQLKYAALKNVVPEGHSHSH